MAELSLRCHANNPTPTALFALTLLPSALAHADIAPPSSGDQSKPLTSVDAQAILWPNSPLTNGTTLGTTSKIATQSDFTSAASKQISLLASLRSWRDTFSGTGTQARRSLFQGKWNGSAVGLSFGNVAPPSISGIGGTGLVANVGAFEVGTTARPEQINAALASWDGLMTGTKPGQNDGQSQTWLRAKPLQGKSGGLELDFSRAARDVAEGDAEDWRGGMFYGGQGTLKLPMRWNINSSWTAAKLDEGDTNTKEAWQAKWMARSSIP